MKHNWEYKRLGDLCNFIGGGTPSKSNEDYFNGNIPWATVRDMLSFQLSDTELHITSDAVNNSATNILPKGMIIISTHVGLGKICELMQETAINQDLKGISFFDNSVDKYFFVYWYRSIANYIISKGRGATVKGVTLDFMRSLQIPVPPMEVQEQIVAELDKINGIIEDCRELLRTLDNLAQSIFYDTFGDPITNTKAFPIVPLSDVFSLITDGTHQTPTYTTNIEKGVKFLSAKDVVNGYIDWTKIKYIPFDLHLELHKRLAPQRGDILLCKNGTTGICALVETDDIFDIYVSLALLRPKANTCGQYLVYAINNPFTREQFNHSLKGIGVPNLHLNKIRTTKIIVPPLALQEKFAERIEQIDAQKKAVEETIANLQTLLDSRMVYWFN